MTGDTNTAIKTTYAEFWLRSLASVVDALVFMALSILVAFGLPFFITQIDARMVLPEVPALFFLEGLMPCISAPYFAFRLNQHLVASHLVGPTESSTLIYASVVGGLVLVNLLYHSIMESSKLQGTIGKLVVGIKVIDKNGKRPSFLATLVRHLFRLFSMLILFCGYFMVLFTPKRQSLHDMVSRCYVVKTES